MSFEFNVGIEEKHTVQFNFSNFWESVSIRVDGEIVQNHLIMLYSKLLSIIIFVFLIIVFFISGVDSVLFLIGLDILGIISFIIYRRRLPFTLIVGENEKHLVKIHKTWKALFGSPEYHVFIDGDFFKTF